MSFIPILYTSLPSFSAFVSYRSRLFSLEYSSCFDLMGDCPLRVFPGVKQNFSGLRKPTPAF